MPKRPMWWRARRAEQGINTGLNRAISGGSGLNFADEELAELEAEFESIKHLFPEESQELKIEQAIERTVADLIGVFKEIRAIRAANSPLSTQERGELVSKIKGDIELLQRLEPILKRVELDRSQKENNSLKRITHLIELGKTFTF